MLKLALACLQSRQSLHCSRACTKWVYIWHIPSVNAHTRLSIHAVSPDPSLLSHMHINGRICDIFFQPMLRIEEACIQACQSLHCSRTCTKWAYIWHIPSVNAQTRLSIHAVSPEPTLLSNMHINGRIYDIFFQPMRRLEVTCMLSCQCLHCSHTCTKWAYIWHIISVNAQTRQSLHCSRTCTKWAYIWHILSINAQTRLLMCAVPPEPSLLSDMHKMDIHMTYSFGEFSDEP